eukprot:2187243-Prymnesium_polylepis.1
MCKTHPAACGPAASTTWQRWALPPRGSSGSVASWRWLRWLPGTATTTCLPRGCAAAGLHEPKRAQHLMRPTLPHVLHRAALGGLHPRQAAMSWTTTPTQGVRRHRQDLAACATAETSPAVRSRACVQDAAIRYSCRAAARGAAELYLQLMKSIAENMNEKRPCTAARWKVRNM